MKKITSLCLALMMLVSVFFLPAKVEAEEVYGYIIPSSSSVYLTEDMISDMDSEVLCYARNEIYARYGYTFRSTELQSYFDSQSWYTPVYSVDQLSSDLLNAYEVSNVELLKEREEELGTYLPDQEGYSSTAVTDYISSHAGSFGADDYTVDPDSYIITNSDSVYLQESDLDSLSAQELNYARNEIYARHGAIFYSTELSDYFGQKNWYLGTIDVDQITDDMLTDCEKANIALLKEKEEELIPGGYVLDSGNYTYSSIHSYTSTSQQTESTDPLAADYIFPESNQRYLTEEDIQGKSLQQICYGRNEIYARRGYIFQSQELRDYFNSKSWYNGTVPAASFSSSVFNEYETANVEFLKNYEFSISADGYQVY